MPNNGWRWFRRLGGGNATPLNITVSVQTVLVLALCEYLWCVSQGDFDCQTPTSSGHRCSLSGLNDAALECFTTQPTISKYSFVFVSAHFNRITFLHITVSLNLTRSILKRDHSETATFVWTVDGAKQLISYDSSKVSSDKSVSCWSTSEILVVKVHQSCRCSSTAWENPLIRQIPLKLTNFKAKFNCPKWERVCHYFSLSLHCKGRWVKLLFPAVLCPKKKKKKKKRLKSSSNYKIWWKHLLYSFFCLFQFQLAGGCRLSQHAGQQPAQVSQSVAVLMQINIQPLTAAFTSISTPE